MAADDPHSLAEQVVRVKKLVNAGLIFFILWLAVENGLHQVQKLILWRRFTPAYVHDLLKSQNQKVLRHSTAGFLTYFVFFKYENPFAVQAEIVFNTSDRVRSHTVRVKTFDAEAVETVPVEDSERTYPLEALTRLAGEALKRDGLDTPIVIDQVLSRSGTLMQLQGRSLEGKGSFEVDFVRKNHEWQVAAWRPLRS